MNEFEVCCRMCADPLCIGSDLMQDEININADCGSYFLESPCDWMEEAASSIEGKLFCPRCSGRVGRISWVGFEAIKGRWITPAIMLTKSRVDIKRRICESTSKLAIEANDTGVQNADLEPQYTTSANSDPITQSCKKMLPNGATDTEDDAVRQEVLTADLDSLEISHSSNAEKSENSHLSAQSDGSGGGDGDGDGGNYDDGDDNTSTSSSSDDDAHPPQSSVASAQDKATNAGKHIYTKHELATMDMVDLVKLLDNGEIEMDELIEACDEAAARKKEEMKRNRDLSNLQVLMAAIKEEVGQDWPELRGASGRLRRGELSPGGYYAAFSDAFARLDAEGLLIPLLDTLPDQAKRDEILQLHRLRQATAS